MTIVVVVIAVVVALILFIATRPADFRIERSISIAASAEQLFPYINDLGKFQQWSPWAERDPNMTMEFDGPQSGVGAKVSWSGNKEVGAGSMTITESKENALIRYALDFLKPMKANHVAEFLLHEDGGSTRVSWVMTGQQDFMGKAFGLFMNLDKMVGGDFEQGLAKLKRLTESPN